MASDGEPIATCITCRGGRVLPGPKPCPTCQATGMLVDASNLFAAVKKANRRYPDAPRDGVYVSPVRLLGDDSITHEIHIVRRNGGNMTTLLVTEDELRQLRDGATACLGGT